MPPDQAPSARRTCAEVRFLLVSAVAAVAFGIVHDSIDVHISPDFYRIFKHAPPTVPVALWAAGVGSVSA